MQLERLSRRMRSKELKIVVIFTLVSLVFGNAVPNKSDRSEFKKSLGKNCDDSYSLTCFKLDAVSWVDKLSENGDINVLPGVSLVRENTSAKANSGEIVAELAREFPDDPDARLDGYLRKKIAGFFDSHSIKLKFWQPEEDGSAGSARKKGGGGGGGGGGLGMALAMGGMMKGMMMAAGLAGVAALAGKALMAALAALMLAAIASLKGSGGGGGGHSTYEVIAKPSYDHGWDSHGHRRSLDNVPLPLGLQPEYKPA